MDISSKLEASVVGVGCVYVLYSVQSFVHSYTILFVSAAFCWSVYTERKWQRRTCLISKTFCRPRARFSVWSVLIFPLCLLSQIRSSDSSTSHEDVLLQSYLLVLNPMYLAHQILERPKHFRDSCAMEIFLEAVFGVGCPLLMGKGWLDSFAFGLMLVAHLYLMRKMLLLLPKTFTYGELVLVSQLIVYFVHNNAMSIIKKMTAENYVLDKEAIIATVVLTVAISVAIFHNSKVTASPIKFYVIYGLLANAIIIFWITLLHPFSFEKLFRYVSRNQIYLLSYWVLWSVMAIAVVIYFNKHKNRIHYDVRKYFHVIMVAVYLPGLLLEPMMLALAAWCAFALLFLLEQFRMYKIPPLSSSLESSLSLFLDEKDSGPLLVSHIYLLVGFSVPVWLSTAAGHSRTPEDYVSCFAGLLTLGVGDTAASVVGIRYGKTKLPGNSRKSVEGTLASIVAQIMGVGCLNYFVSVPLTPRILFTLSSASFYEAFTDQIDNLTLPLFTYSLLRLSS
ncbi:dolichol kinase [Octopus bimaculoides]|uniref:dolichol kinase n=1 Tax=Octopus bimaculoides TaxID=37653 RepID=A0A0L8HHA2_OCTBM|nr:dolichol kinase [Octopus bimaculoides]XP_014772612.1 dolichol kinase [Octopus bimaculoides]XP_052832294.1 dolichol kinase [Octopus bimaculoides]|eukprot:XP_014772611.1 PREDICTED: dolichol kinase-like [Octopus bimaculoides]